MVDGVLFRVAAEHQLETMRLESIWVDDIALLHQQFASVANVLGDSVVLQVIAVAEIRGEVLNYN